MGQGSEGVVLLDGRDSPEFLRSALNLLEAVLPRATDDPVPSQSAPILVLVMPPARSSAWPTGERGNVFRREGDYWTVAFDGSVVRLRDTKGLRHLARLLASPGREFTAVGLEGADAGEPAAPRVVAGELEDRADLGDAGELLDATAKARYRARLEDLRDQLDEAEAWGDPIRAATAKEEIEVLTGELARAVGLGGRDRRAASHAERARLNATRAIRAAVRKLSRAHASLGRHLEATIRTGRYCSYTPDPHAPVAWQVDVTLPPP